MSERTAVTVLCSKSICTMADGDRERQNHGPYIRSHDCLKSELRELDTQMEKPM